jgi:hypothetical protein
MRRLLPVCILLPLLMAGCADKDLEKIAKNMLTISAAVAQVQSDTITANQLKLIDDDATAKVLEVCRAINMTGLKIDATIRAISQLNPESRKLLINLLMPISTALDPLQMPWLEQITDANLRQTLTASFLLMRSTISTMQIILAAG